MWLWGTTGTGKSHFVNGRHNPKDIYWKSNNKWWDGYTQQEAICIDDFDIKMWNFRDLLQIFDKYAKSIEFKGGCIQLYSKYIYITCEDPPEKCFTEGNTLDQVMRRIRAKGDVIEFKTRYFVPNYPITTFEGSAAEETA